MIAVDEPRELALVEPAVAVADELDGDHIDARLAGVPAEVLAGQSRPGNGWGKSSPEEQARRSVYIHIKRSLLVPLLDAFDLESALSELQERCKSVSSMRNRNLPPSLRAKSQLNSAERAGRLT